MSGFFGADPQSIIDSIGSAFRQLAPGPEPGGTFQPSGGTGAVGAFRPAPAVAGDARWPTVSPGVGPFQPAELNLGTFAPSGDYGGGWRPSTMNYPGFQPSGTYGSPFQPSGVNPLLAPPVSTPTTGSANPLAGPGGTPGTPSTGMKPGVARWAGQAQQVFGQYADVMLAIMTNESGGDPNAFNAAGPAYGLFQQLNKPGLTADQQFASAKALLDEKLSGIANSYAANGLSPDQRTRARDIALAWAGHFDYATGLPNPHSRDAGPGRQTAAELSDIFLANYDAIVNGRQRAPTGANVPAGPALRTIFGGQNPGPTMQNFGRTDYSVQHPETYGYGKYYGLDGLSHPGIDYAMPTGSKLYVPLDGTVFVVGNDHGTGYYYTDNHGNNPDHSGELAIQLANGDIVILGHMSSIALQVGQRVAAGTFAGLSGGSDGDHLHLEVRVKDSSLPSGYRIVDPNSYFAGR